MMNRENTLQKPAATDVYNMLPTVDVEKINFMAELSQDVFKIISVKRNEFNELCFTEPHWLQQQKYRVPYREHFSIKGNKIYFSGEFSRWWIIRLWQKWKERRNPIKYKIEYLTADMCEQPL